MKKPTAQTYASGGAGQLNSELKKPSTRPGGAGDAAGRSMREKYTGGDAWMGRGFGEANMAFDGGPMPDDVTGPSSGTSVFDPVLCELAYRWFCPPEGTVLDPFAGGSVRGIVAGRLGLHYVGIDLSARQIEANEQQAEHICAPNETGGTVPEENMPEVTPVERVGDYWIKRDDTFCVAGVRGGKARACWHLAQGAEGLITAGARQSPQVAIVAAIADELGIPCRCHVPAGKLTDELNYAQRRGAILEQHKPGYNTVIVKRAKDDAAESGWTLIPFGMECEEAPKQTASQVVDLPEGTRRIVVPVGSGMSLAGIVQGLAKREADGEEIPQVLGVVVGADPGDRLNEYAPGWQDYVELVRSPLEYHTYASETRVGDVEVDPIYEAKCIPFLEPGDLLWCVGVRPDLNEAPAQKVERPTWIVGDSRNAATLAPGEYDFIFSCPPYYDLEVYTEDPNDLSQAQEYTDFIEAYAEIIAACVGMLKQDRFACFVVGDIRDEDGFYRGFPRHTIAAFENAGAKLYNDAVLVTAVGSLPVRVGRQFGGYRKLGKTHQRVLVFYKGDPQEVKANFPEVTEGEDYGAGNG